MLDLSKDGFTHEEVMDMLHSKRGSRQIRFRFDLLDKYENKIIELKSVEGGSIDMSAFSDIKRSAKFTITESTYERESYANWSDVGSKKWSEI